MSKIETDETGAVFVNVPWQLRRSGKRVMIVGPESTLEDFKNEALAQAITKAHQYARMIETGKYDTVLELAKTLKTDRSAVARTLALVNLAPDVITAVFNGTAPETLTVAKLVKGFPEDWREQRIEFGMA